ncbi:helix-turn-helix domain-containing protein [Hymenobacter yonginensis]|uniref:Helix-turn-helix domain-containing protein n=1 Tax=Hymenobacter yonginensis TaxID=748197 RepID=A0ABY7PJ52_9BACT|nr:helix-turn-helix domain-containing protein [Hymenobacter yonginensis]WBO83312.1 helix-turn-helix domain-containing protein [Hymenobacter yonginensis]
MNLVVLQSEAYDQLQQNTFAYMRKLMEQERKKATIDWLDNAEAAALLKISKRTLQSWRDEGLIGFSQIGGKIYYNREEIDRMLLKHHHKPFRATA